MTLNTAVMKLKILPSITGINYIFKYITTVFLNVKNISQYYCLNCIFDQINAALLSRRNFFQKLKNLPDHHFMNCKALRV